MILFMDIESKFRILNNCGCPDRLKVFVFLLTEFTS